MPFSRLLPSCLLALALSGAALCVAAAPIKAGVYPSYPPLDMRDPASNQLSGFDVEFGEALAAKLGTSLDWHETNFAELIAATRTGRIQIFFNGMFDTPERREQVAFVDYLRSGSQFMTLAGGAATAPGALCGKRIGISRLTNGPAVLKAWNAITCTRQGRAEAIYVPADNSIDARIQMKQGRTDAVMQDSLTVPHVMSQERGRYVALGEPIDFQLMGIGVDKADASLQKRVAGAVQQLIDDGSYARLMKKWGLPASSALSRVSIDAGHTR